jgi:hypothetical protein
LSLWYARIPTQALDAIAGRDTNHTGTIVLQQAQFVAYEPEVGQCQHYGQAVFFSLGNNAGEKGSGGSNVYKVVPLSQA